MKKTGSFGIPKGSEAHEDTMSNISIMLRKCTMKMFVCVQVYMYLLRFF